jgi:hypothetical protein
MKKINLARPKNKFKNMSLVKKIKKVSLKKNQKRNQSHSKLNSKIMRTPLHTNLPKFTLKKWVLSYFLKEPNKNCQKKINRIML